MLAALSLSNMFDITASARYDDLLLPPFSIDRISRPSVERPSVSSYEFSRDKRLSQDHIRVRRDKCEGEEGGGRWLVGDSIVRGLNRISFLPPTDTSISPHPCNYPRKTRIRRSIPGGRRAP